MNLLAMQAGTKRFGHSFPLTDSTATLLKDGFIRVFLKSVTVASALRAEAEAVMAVGLFEFTGGNYFCSCMRGDDLTVVRA